MREAEQHKDSLLLFWTCGRTICLLNNLLFFKGKIKDLLVSTAFTNIPPVYPLLMIHSLLQQQTDILGSACIYKRHFQSLQNKVEQGRTDDPTGPSNISSVPLHRTGWYHSQTTAPLQYILIFMSGAMDLMLCVVSGGFCSMTGEKQIYGSQCVDFQAVTACT